jgi:hypothetical protein
VAAVSPRRGLKHLPSIVAAIPLNLATAALIAFLLFRTLQLYSRNAFTLWPTLPANSEPQPTA